MSRAISEGNIGQRQPRAQGDETVGQAQFHMLASIGDLVERSPGRTDTVGQEFSVSDREAKVVMPEAIHPSTVPMGTNCVNTLRSYTYRYKSSNIREMDTYERLQALLAFIRAQFCGGKAAELARKIHRSDSYVNRLFYPQGKNGAKGIGPEIMQACTEAFDLPRGFWEMSPEEARIELTSTSTAEATPAEDSPRPPGSIEVNPLSFRPVWVVGKGAGGLAERIWTDGDHPVGATDQYGLVSSTDPHAFLVEVSEESMVPVYTPGNFALVEPGTEPEIEDDVLVRLVSGQTMIKRLLSRRGAYRFGSYNSTVTLHYRFEDVDWVYYIAHPVPRRKIKSHW